MAKKIYKTLIMLIILTATISCSSKKKAVDEGAENIGATTSTDLGEALDSDSGKALGLQTVHYAYDSSLLDDIAKKKLDENAKILKANKNIKIQIEGHCDERGGIQYNIALGERRALAAKKYLVNKGVEESRISIISYGKEKPIDPGHTEEAWAKNRRANFRITEK